MDRAGKHTVITFLPGPKRLTLPGRSNSLPYQHLVVASAGLSRPELTGSPRSHGERSRPTSEAKNRSRRRNTPQGERYEYLSILQYHDRAIVRNRFNIVEEIAMLPIAKHFETCPPPPPWIGAHVAAWMIQWSRLEKTEQPVVRGQG